MCPDLQRTNCDSALWLGVDDNHQKRHYVTDFLGLDELGLSGARVLIDEPELCGKPHRWRFSDH
jgi:hypothetical protein